MPIPLGKMDVAGGVYDLIEEVSMASVHDVAAAVLKANNGPLSTMKLQKLVYYCQAWHLVWDDEPLFDEQIEAWAGGPVVRALYNCHRGSYSVSDWPTGDASKLTQSQLDTVTVVVGSYGQLSGSQLSHLTHQERPWNAAREGLEPGVASENIITQEEIADYYAAVGEAIGATPITELTSNSPTA